MLTINQKVPDFETSVFHQNKEKKIRLSQYRGRWLVLIFYPADFTFICPTELRGFAKHATEFEKLSAKVLAASTDSEWSHKNWFERDLPDVDYPILADTTQTISRAYDVLSEDDGSSERGTFIINPDGNLCYALISAGSVGRSVKETLRVLEALQTGERCPVEWEPGAVTLGKG